MNRVLSLPVALATLVCATSTWAQTTFPEVEPNSQKSEATVVTGMLAGDALTGVSTGTSTVLGSGLITTADVFRVRLAALPPAVYKHTLTITSTGPSGYTGYIRGLNQVNGVIGATDIIFQTSAAQVNQWYGFGKQEQINYQVQGGASTTGTYSATLATTTVTPVAVAGSFLSGLVTITTAGQGHTSDTELYIYDSALNPIPLGHHDGVVGNSTVSTVQLALAPGTYYIANSLFNTSNNQSDLAPTEGWDDDNLLEYPDAMACNSTTNGANVAFSVSDGVTTTPVPATKSTNFEIIWATFNVIPNPNPPANDACAAATTVTNGTYAGLMANATNDGAASCDAGGPASRDVWYTFTDTTASGGTLSLDTCGTSGMDTALSVYNACGGAEIACNDNCGGAPCAGTTSCLTVAIAPNQTVKIRVSDKGLGGNLFTLHSAYVGNPPVNDHCTSPITLGGPGVYNFDTTLATSGEGTTGACGGAPVKNLWYAYTATTNGSVTISTCNQTSGTTTDTEIWIYQGAGCPSLASIACNDDFCGLQTTVTTAVTCGTVYMFEVGNYDGQTAGNIFGTFTVTETGTACSTPSTPECPGDTAALCPCAGPGGSGVPNPGSAGNGCANSSFPAGALLTSSGIAVDNPSDTLVLTCTNMPGPGLFFQANGLLGPIVNFNDGTLCAASGIIRMGVVFPTSGSASYPGGLTPNPIHIAGAPVMTPNPTKHYQCWYRDITPGFCNTQGHNMSNGVALTWSP